MLFSLAHVCGVSLTTSGSFWDLVLQRWAGWNHGCLLRTGLVPQPFCLPPHLLNSKLKPLQFPLQTFLLTLQQVLLSDSPVQCVLQLGLSSGSCPLLNPRGSRVPPTQLGHQDLQQAESGLQSIHLWTTTLWAAGLRGARHSKGVLASPTSVIPPPQRSSVLCFTSQQQTT